MSVKFIVSVWNTFPRGAAWDTTYAGDSAWKAWRAYREGVKAGKDVQVRRYLP
ncbi:hypothetical protein SEA_BENCZKOWSKI14_49 [Gordonia phage Benczkowski14]|uniref:Uncharacterized protein n=4 Tax=Demosthenesvirus katyusha TaxID=1982108 RepID=A0A345MCI5_9CAUD|nr:hypothetical protein FDH67_gp49 [Gordonia phage Katyusha]AMS03759.1 hypothetical protein SEA_BENCZKOWSKI14_49 [Gordonia phage Benczkowski14]AXH68206.1 hypothetical protein SEA_TEATEALATTE_50 [Gordonia phage Teatealatte]QBP29655.1 hypothetical protein SEA_TREDGE_50 [Gordonia phage Tredge]UJD20734.1 hypothetical protein SEA_NIAGARA_49 [Gordonia phage Niagara]AMS03442.1 hypothetical protein SEA_KATYUSHA_49 [Gordonia phage Katyusha]